MSDNIPIEIQSEIMKRLPIKPLIQFRSLSKAWKSLIDSSIFINEHIQTQIQTQPQAHHVLIRYENYDNRRCLSLRDDDSFPNDRFSHTVPDSFPNDRFNHALPEFVYLLRNEVLLGSSHGVVCFYGSYLDMGLKVKMAVLWNPTVKKSVGIVVPNVVYLPLGKSFVGFGVCADNSDAKIVKINVFEMPGVHWEVEVFTLSSRSWKRLSINPPFELCHLRWKNISIDGLIYWDGFHKTNSDEPNTHFIVSFDLKKEEFGVVCLPDSLVHSDVLKLFKRNESLVVVDYIIEAEDGTLACEVWEMKDGATKSFNMMFSFKSSNPNEIASHREILGFRKNGEAIMERLFSDGDYDGQVGSLLEVYDPSSRRIVRIPIAGNARSFVLTSYIETILLLGESNSIIR